MRELKDRLKEYRVNRGYSQEDLAIHLTTVFGVNVAKDTVKGWESNKHKPKIQTMAKLRNLLDKAGIEP